MRPLFLSRTRCISLHCIAYAGRTSDEDFSLLLEAAKLYDVCVEESTRDNAAPRFPRLLILVTGACVCSPPES